MGAEYMGKVGEAVRLLPPKKRSRTPKVEDLQYRQEPSNWVPAHVYSILGKDRYRVSWDAMYARGDYTVYTEKAEDLRRLSADEKKSLPLGWSPYQDDKDRTYYHNKDTEESTWEKPMISHDWSTEGLNKFL